jgi:glutathione S-transferase
MTLPYQQEFELYHYGESVCSQMVRIALSEKGIPYKSHHMHLESTGEHLTADYKKINPLCLVPVLLHHGNPIYSTWEIIKYLDRYAPEQRVRLLPDDAGRRAQVDAYMADSELNQNIGLGENFGTSCAGVSIPILVQKLRTRPLWAIIWDYLLKHPIKERKFLFVMLRIFGWVPGGLYKTCIKRVALGLATIESALEGEKDYLFGDYSGADVMMTAHFHRLEDVALGEILRSNELPNISAYWQRLKQRPSYQTAIMDWHKSDWRNAMKVVYGGEPNPYADFLSAEVKTNHINESWQREKACE